MERREEKLFEPFGTTKEPENTVPQWSTIEVRIS